MEKNNMYDYLKDALANELFSREPLANAIMCVLAKEDPEIFHKILRQFDAIISTRLDTIAQNNYCNLNPDEESISAPAAEDSPFHLTPESD